MKHFNYKGECDICIKALKEELFWATDKWFG